MDKQTHTNPTELIIKQVLESWSGRNKAFTDFFTKYPDADYLNEVAPGRNRAIYLLGHLIAANDGLRPLFGLGERLFPELEIYNGNADRSFEINASVEELKTKWAALNDALTTEFSKMTVNDWLGKHTAVSTEDFAKEPHRNKLNVLLSRTNHLSYHLGQLNLLTVNEPAL